MYEICQMPFAWVCCSTSDVHQGFCQFIFGGFDPAVDIFSSILKFTVLGVSLFFWWSWSFLTLPSKTSHVDTFHEFLIFTHLWRAFIFLLNDTKIMQICLQVKKLLINQSGYWREFHSDKLGWENSFPTQQYYSSYNLKIVHQSTQNCCCQINLTENCCFQMWLYRPK